MATPDDYANFDKCTSVKLYTFLMVTVVKRNQVRVSRIILPLAANSKTRTSLKKKPVICPRNGFIILGDLFLRGNEEDEKVRSESKPPT